MCKRNNGFRLLFNRYVRKVSISYIKRQNLTHLTCTGVHRHTQFFATSLAEWWAIINCVILGVN